MKLTYIFTLLLLLVKAGFTQNSNPDNYYAEFLKRPLLVVAKDYTERFSALMESSWKIKNPSVEYVTEAEALEMLKENNDYYSLLEVGEVIDYDKYAKAAVMGSLSHGSSLYAKKRVYLVSFPFDELDDFDLQIAIEFFNSNLPLLAKGQPTFNVEADIERLRNKTLLVPEEWVEPGFTKQLIEDSYGASVRIENLETIREIVLEGSDKYAFLYAIYSPVYSYIIAIDAATFDVWSGISVKVQFTTGKKLKGKDYLKIKHFKYFLGATAQTMNRRYFKY